MQRPLFFQRTSTEPEFIRSDDGRNLKLLPRPQMIFDPKQID